MCHKQVVVRNITKRVAHLDGMLRHTFVRPAGQMGAPQGQTLQHGYSRPVPCCLKIATRSLWR